MVYTASSGELVDIDCTSPNDSDNFFSNAIAARFLNFLKKKKKFN